jgi:hypothetical protein
MSEGFVPPRPTRLQATGPPAAEITDLAAVKAYVVDAKPADDARLTALLELAAAAVEAEVARRRGTKLGRVVPVGPGVVMRRPWSESFAAGGGRKLQLSRWPVDPTNLVVKLNDQEVTDEVTLFAFDGFLERAAGWDGAVTVTYEAGYTGAAGEDPMPRSVAGAVHVTVAHHFLDHPRVGARKDDDASVDYVATDVSTYLPPAAASLLPEGV